MDHLEQNIPEDTHLNQRTSNKTLPTSSTGQITASNSPGTGRDVSLEEMMNAREKRCALQQHLLNQYKKCLVCLTLNIPGPVKVQDGVPEAFAAGCSRIRQGLSEHGIKICHFEPVTEKTGYEAFFSVNADARTVKRLMTALEDQDRLGRLFDIDVLQTDGKKLSREDLGFPARRCLLCGEAAQVCARSRRHSVEELTAEVSQILQPGHIRA